jgi:hypothetical protein
MTSDNKDKKLHKTDWLGNIGCVVLLLLFVSWGAVIYNGVHRSLTRGTIDLKAEVTVNEGIITLKNNNGFDWRTVWFSLDTDDNPETYEYSYYLSEIPGHKTVTIVMSKFMRLNLYPFDILTTVPKHLSFFAQTSEGTGHYIYTWPGY